MSWLTLSSIIAPVAASMVSLLAKPVVDWITDRAIFRGNRQLRVTLPGGKTEYIVATTGGPEELSASLDHYLAYENTVKDALGKIENGEFFAMDEPYRADFKVVANGRSYLIEAKTHPEVVTGKELGELLDEDGADELIFVTPSDLPLKQRNSLIKTSGGKIQFVSGTDAAAIGESLAQIMRISVR